MKVDRVYTKGKVSFMDILDPYIDLKIEELITSSNRKQNTGRSQIELKELI
ncbi:hypothetical protein [Bacillus sp. JJ1562]|uniref:hypothetical protein n=1 Tax=Bacillus sp. JJ1562 TaxID=3122960 RepID=UPI003001A697